jgi:Zn-dependent peptidase ImmA (M78 family)
MNGGWSNVWTEAERFRQQYLGDRSTALPVDIFTVVELKLRLDVIPFDDLAAKYRVEAALTQDFSGLYVDAESYVFWEKGPVWKQNRLRFTVAHELGHLVLHREQANKVKFASFAQFAAYFKANDGPRYAIEQEANEFAGRLLVPVERLRECFDQFAAKAAAFMPNWQLSEDLRSKFADSIGPKFGVNAQVILARLDREDLWPSR